ncbi:MAG: septation protein SepH [Actinomycetota bacterium]
MNRLFLLGFTNDLKGVVFSQRRGSKQAKFWVPIDAKFLDAVKKLDRVRADRSASPARKTKAGRQVPDAAAERFRAMPPSRPLPAVGRSQATSGMPASEIQQLLREGRSVKSVSEAAKVSPGWVERLAHPVLVERNGVVRMAQRAVMPRPRLGPSGLPIGEAVFRNLEERRATPETIEELEDAWDARASRAGDWRVSLRFTHRGRRRLAEWSFHKGKHEIHPRNRLAAELGWWPPSDDETEEPPPDVEGETVEPGAETQEPQPRAQRAPARPKRKPSRKSKKKVRPGPRARKAKPTRGATKAKPRRTTRARRR